jgi:prevent-host-death family protein
MMTLSVTEARGTLSEVVNRVQYGGERVTIQKHGAPAVVLVSVEDAQLLAQLEDRIDLRQARAALAEAKAKGTKPWNQVKKDLGL